MSVFPVPKEKTTYPSFFAKRPSLEKNGLPLFQPVKCSPGDKRK